MIKIYWLINRIYEIAFQDIDTRLRNIEAYIYDQQHKPNEFALMR